jgi:hypothetical protein
LQRVLRASGSTITLLIYDANGALVDPVPGTAVAAVVDSAGVAISGSPFTATRNSIGNFSFTVPATLNVLDTYQVTWTLGDGSLRYTEFEMVGGFYFTIAELRATDGTLAAYSADNCRAVRDQVEARFEQRCNVAFVPRGRRWVFPGNSSYVAQLPDIYVRDIIAVSVGGVALSQPNVDAIQIFPGGVIQRVDGIWATATTAIPQNCSVLYEFGMAEPPGPVKQAALRYARHLAVPHAFDDDRMISYQTDVGTIQQAIARNGQLGYPDIDSVLDAYANIDAMVL